MNFKTVLSVSILLFLGLVTHAHAEEPFSLSLPVDCEIGKTCFVQNYVDHDPGPGRQDFQCRAMTYDGHEGTDFRVLSLVEQRAGVPVLAASDGVVLRVRDGEPDISFRSLGAQIGSGRDCGNAVVIDHGNHWQTQYCHLALNSVSVRPGQKLKRGDLVGRIGLSGRTEFPHLHLSVRLNGEIVDPFAPLAEPGQCGKPQESLWAADIRDRLFHRSRVVLNRGFSDGPVASADVETGSVAGRKPTPGSGAIVAYVRAIGLEVGDVQRLTLRNPEGALIADTFIQPLAKPLAQQMLYVGYRRPAAGWISGIYEASYTIERDGRSIAKDIFSHRF
ncbi:MAG: M23 family metallopeptidase [Hyphomicrobiales bacterium]